MGECVCGGMLFGCGERLMCGRDVVVEECVVGGRVVGSCVVGGRVVGGCVVGGRAVGS